MQEAYNDFVGCGYAIQYPLWEKHNDGLGTVFLSARHPLLDVNKKRLLPRSLVMNTLTSIFKSAVNSVISNYDLLRQ